jgi:hypothetical protein
MLRLSLRGTLNEAKVPDVIERIAASDGEVRNGSLKIVS